MGAPAATSRGVQAGVCAMSIRPAFATRSKSNGPVCATATLCVATRACRWLYQEPVYTKVCGRAGRAAGMQRCGSRACDCIRSCRARRLDAGLDWWPRDDRQRLQQGVARPRVRLPAVKRACAGLRAGRQAWWGVDLQSFRSVSLCRKPLSRWSFVCRARYPSRVVSIQHARLMHVLKETDAVRPRFCAVAHAGCCPHIYAGLFNVNKPRGHTPP